MRNGAADSGRIASQVCLPETVAHDHFRRAATLLKVVIESAAQHGADSECREIIGGDQLTPHAFRLAAQNHAEGHRRGIGKRRRKQFPVFAELLIVRIGDRGLECHQGLGMGHVRQVTEYRGVELAERRRGRADAQAERRQRDQRESRRGGQHAHAIAYVLPEFGQVLRRHADRNIQQQPRQAGQSMMPPDIFDGVFRGLQQFLGVGILEFIGKGARQQASTGAGSRQWAGS